MNLRDLKYLVTVADLKHFSKAAEQCHVTQPTLSAQLKKLEEFLGVTLIERNNRNVMLTPAGSEVVHVARDILALSDRIKDIAKSGVDPFTGVLKIGIIPTLGPYLLPHMVPVLKKHFPKLELFIYEEKTHVILNRLVEGELDTIIASTPLEAEQIELRVLFNERFVVALPKGHVLAINKEISTEELKKEPILLLEDGHCMRDQALEICDVFIQNEKRNFRATSLETLKQMVMAGVGITLLPAMAAAAEHVDAAQLEIRPFAQPIPSRKVVMAWRKTSTRKESIEAICSHLKR